MRPTFVLRLFLCTGLLAFACGRTDLDLGASDVPVTTGSAGATGAAGAGTTGGGGDVGTGTAGTTSTGVGTGTAGTRATTGAAGTTSTGAAGTASVGTAGTGTTGAAGTTSTGAAGAIGPITGAAGTGPAPPPPNQIRCGTQTCLAGTQSCCIQIGNGQASASCIPAGQSCDMGASFSCSATSQCGGAQVCCVSTLNLSTMCEAPVQCLTSAGVILCTADTDCPRALPNCCGVGNLRICRAVTCGGGGGGGRPGGGTGMGGGRGRGPGGGGAPAPGAPPAPPA